VKWIAVSEGILVLLAGETDKIKQSFMVKYPLNPVGNCLTAYELSTGKELWRHQETQTIEERRIAVHRGRVFAACSEASVLCRDLKTGELQWENHDPAQLGNLNSSSNLRNDESYQRTEPNKLLPGAPVLLTQKAMTVLDKGVVIGDYSTCQKGQHPKLISLSPENGSFQCKLPSSDYPNLFTIGEDIDGNWWTRNGDLIDLTNGKKVGSLGMPGGFYVRNCGSTISAPGMLITCHGLIVDRKSGKTLAKSEVKSPCDMGTVVSDGVIVSPPSSCRCDFENCGYRVLMSGALLHPESGLNPAKQLETASTTVPPPLDITALDWPTYRGNCERTGSTPALIPDLTVQRWQWKPAKPVDFHVYTVTNPERTTSIPDFVPSPPIAAAGKIWFGDASGILRCLDAATGQIVWSLPTGAKMFTAPTVWKGCLYAGSGNGYVYCLDAVTGRELWRFHAAPLDRRMMWYGHLISTWPIVTGVLVRDGTAYFAAGHQGINGIYVYALDAETGIQRWEAHKFSFPANNGGGSGAVGPLTIANGRLWLAGGGAWPVSFDLKTGISNQPVADNGYPTRGGDIGVIGGNFMIYGGKRLAFGYDEQERDERIFFSLNENGTQRFPDIGVRPNGMLSVWDAEMFVQTHHSNVLLEAWSVPKLTTFLGAQIVSPKDLASNGPRYYPKWVPPPEAKPANPPSSPNSTNPPAPPSPAAAKKPQFLDTPMQCWHAENYEVRAVALTANAVVAACKINKAWVFATFNRSTGELKSSSPLPSEPTYSGLCVDHDGSVFITMRDGSIASFGKS